MEVQGNHPISRPSPVSSVRLIQVSLYTLFATALYYRTRSFPISLAATTATVIAGEYLYRSMRKAPPQEAPPQPEKLISPAYPVATEGAQAPDNRYWNITADPWNVLEVNGKAINASWMPRLLFCRGGCKKLADKVPGRGSTPDWDVKMGNAWRSWAQEKVPNDLPDYIATQGPLEKTCEQFWEMAWQHNTPHIICLTNTREKKSNEWYLKCHPYWPEDDEPLTFGPFTLQRKATVKRGEICETTLAVTREGEERNVVHLHHTGWGDHGTIAKEDMEALIKRDEELYNSALVKGPIILHCSAGIGRTGTFLGCKIGHHNPQSAPLDTIIALRACRVQMVQTPNQGALVEQFYQVQEPLSKTLFM